MVEIRTIRSLYPESGDLQRQTCVLQLVRASQTEVAFAAVRAEIGSDETRALKTRTDQSADHQN